MTDLAALDAFLRSDSSPDDCMQLSDLDGFLTSVICSPVMIMPSEWLPVALGTQQIDIPVEILELIMQRYNEIVEGLNSEPPFSNQSSGRPKKGMSLRWIGVRALWMQCL